ncbi:ORF6N domain-containing protein [Butyricicoccus faecihominis]|uniref:ORF6N domain-containing protein n=1 Tax=Butyricicoccus faecihominis TaxID=1712515 RepID=UPI00247AD416|nr:ORF6N domain-containing protein [Butyricicoccus faecihominis]MCQ5129109.1 ORF6N domain-containing protein [Butyricicoccus faecihominis]
MKKPYQSSNSDRAKNKISTYLIAVLEAAVKMNNLVPIEREGQRVLLTNQLAESYETETQVITNNFNRNRERYKVGKHFYALEGEDKRDFINLTQIDLGSAKNSKTLYLWTQRGALLHAKSLNTDRAWEVYDELVETYFKAQDMKANLNNLSPQLQLLIGMEIEQKRQAAELVAVNDRLDNISDIVSLDANAWRDRTKKIIVQIADAWGGAAYIQEVHNELYRLLEQTARVDLKRRMENRQRRMAEEGVCKSRRDKLNRLDIIADDAKLVPIYLDLVKRLAIKNRIDIQGMFEGMEE